MSESAIFTRPVILWDKLTDIEQAALRNYQKRNYPDNPLKLAEKKPDILDFDPAKEVSKAPESENHMRG